MAGARAPRPPFLAPRQKPYDRSSICMSCTRSNRVTRGARHSGRGARAPKKLSQRFHSARRAITGSTRDALRAGSQQAIITAMPSTIAAQMHAIRLGAGHFRPLISATRPPPKSRCTRRASASVKPKRKQTRFPKPAQGESKVVISFSAEYDHRIDAAGAPRGNQQASATSRQITPAPITMSGCTAGKSAIGDGRRGESWKQRSSANPMAPCARQAA